MAENGLERRFCELRVEGDGRTVEGVAVRYGDIAELPWGDRERFDAGAFGDLGQADVLLNFQHQRAVPLARTGGGGLELRDSASALLVRAELPRTRDCDDTLALIRAKVLRGLSIEFVAVRDRREGNLRIVEAAKLRGVAVVDSPAYPGSAVAARGRQPRKAWWL